MKNLTIKYSRRDFFGNRIYTEDTKENFTKADLTKAFLFLSKNNDAAVQVDSMVIYWDTFSEFENKTVSVRMYDTKSYTEGKTPFDVIKKNFYAKYKNQAGQNKMEPDGKEGSSMVRFENYEITEDSSSGIRITNTSTGAEKTVRIDTDECCGFIFKCLKTKIKTRHTVRGFLEWMDSLIADNFCTAYITAICRTYAG